MRTGTACAPLRISLPRYGVRHLRGCREWRSVVWKGHFVPIDILWGFIFSLMVQLMFSGEAQRAIISTFFRTHRVRSRKLRAFVARWVSLSNKLLQPSFSAQPKHIRHLVSGTSIRLGLSLDRGVPCWSRSCVGSPRRLRRSWGNCRTCWGQRSSIQWHSNYRN